MFSARAARSCSASSSSLVKSSICCCMASASSARTRRLFSWVRRRFFSTRMLPYCHAKKPREAASSRLTTTSAVFRPCLPLFACTWGPMGWGGVRRTGTGFCIRPDGAGGRTAPSLSSASVWRLRLQLAQNSSPSGISLPHLMHVTFPHPFPRFFPFYHGFRQMSIDAQVCRGRMWASAPTNESATCCVGVDAHIDPGG